jgi:hypothetical protein
MVKLLPLSRCLGRRVIAWAILCVDRCQREPTVRVEASSADLDQSGSMVVAGQWRVFLLATMRRLNSGVNE